VIVNLVGNAIKFTPHGKVYFHVAVDDRADGFEVLHFSVRDTGIGIPQERQASIFDAFSQADNSTTRRFGGTGLGLAISSHLVQMMGGRIWVESEPNKGSCFHFTIKAAVAPPLLLTEGDADTAEEQATAETNGAHFRILLAEDNPINQKVAMNLLKKRGHTVRVAANGKEALAEMESNRFDLVLMDIQMPEMDGVEACRAIRKREEGSGMHTPVIALTAHAMTGDRDRFLAAGMDGFASKPIQMDELMAEIGRLQSVKVAAAVGD
jgi:CheY-like chemotaxis protein